MLESEIKEAEAESEASLAQIKSNLSNGAQDLLKAALQNIESMEKAILIARRMQN